MTRILEKIPAEVAMCASNTCNSKSVQSRCGQAIIKLELQEIFKNLNNVFWSLKLPVVITHIIYHMITDYSLLQNSRCLSR